MLNSPVSCLSGLASYFSGSLNKWILSPLNYPFLFNSLFFPLSFLLLPLYPPFSYSFCLLSFIFSPFFCCLSSRLFFFLVIFLITFPCLPISLLSFSCIPISLPCSPCRLISVLSYPRLSISLLFFYQLITTSHTDITLNICIFFPKKGTKTLHLNMLGIPFLRSKTVHLISVLWSSITLCHSQHVGRIWVNHCVFLRLHLGREVKFVIYAFSRPTREQLDGTLKSALSAFNESYGSCQIKGRTWEPLTDKLFSISNGV